MNRRNPSHSKQSGHTFFGYVLGVLVFTPFADWRFSHLRHHASYANLDARGFGDIWTLTRSEYVAASRLKRLFYRFYRSPVGLLGLGALFSFVLRPRLKWDYSPLNARLHGIMIKNSEGLGFGE